MRKRIWIDGQCFQTASNVRGIGRYVAELLRALKARGDAELVVSLNANMGPEAIAARRFLERLLPEVEIQVWFGTAADGESLTGYTPMRKADARILVEHVNALAPDLALSPSLFEGFHDLCSPLVETDGLVCPTACIFHDAIPHRFPERYFHHPELTAGYYRRLLAVGHFDLILCNSDFTVDELADILDRQDGVSIGAGLASAFVEAMTLDEEAGAMDPPLPEHYVLHVGGLDWRKNIPALISAMALLPQVRRGDLSLVLAGGGGTNELVALRAQWALLGLPPAGLVATGWISDAQLVACYRHAAVAVQPSLMEGFGLAALEAMTIGCPFLAAHGGAAGEVLGNPAQAFDGEAPVELATLIERVQADASFREEIVACGKARAPRFDWHQSAAIAMGAIERLLAGKIWAKPARPAPTPSAPRIVMDVTATAQSPLNSGIQRVIRRLSAALIATGQDAPPAHAPTVLTYADNPSGWYRVRQAWPHAISRSPLDRLGHGAGDIHLMLDSSWGLPHIQRPRLQDALVLGQEVIHGVHDIGPLTMPAMTVPGMPSVFAEWFRFILGHSTGIVCVSRATADEVDAMIRAIRLPRPMKIGYIQLGADFADGTAGETWLDMPGDAPVFLMVGTIEPRKGHALVLDAFDRYWEAGGQGRLLMIGHRGWNTRLLDLRLQNHPQRGTRLFVHSNVSDAQLRSAYDRADALIMASYLEGFGLPVVEAGHLGCPVILSDLPVFREVAKGARQVDFFPAGDVQALAACLQRTGRRLARPHAADATAPAKSWPDWQGTAQQLHDIIFANQWYKTYEPEEVAANAVPAFVGELRMMARLSEEDQQYSIRYVDGPLLADDGDSVQISVGIRNEGREIWTSTPSPQDGLQINVASHIIDGRGVVVDEENPRSHIPFAMPPGQEIVFPVRVSTDWLARGAHHVDVMMVQELVTRFGTPFRVPLTQRPSSPATYQPSTDSLAQTRLDLVKAPWMVSGTQGPSAILAVTNVGRQTIAVSARSIHTQTALSFLGHAACRDCACTVASAFDRLEPGHVGLLTLIFSERCSRAGYGVEVALGGGDSLRIEF